MTDEAVGQPEFNEDNLFADEGTMNKPKNDRPKPKNTQGLFDNAPIPGLGSSAQQDGFFEDDGIFKIQFSKFRLQK